MHEDKKQQAEASGLDYLSELPQARPHIHETRKFPDGFLWGTATSSHQVEGGNDKNDWWDWEQQPGRILDEVPSGRACDHYNRYEEDFDIAKALNTNAHRLSLEWSRLEPTEGHWNRAEVEHYRKVLQALKDRGFTVMLTVWHFTLPTWFAAKGGWEATDAIRSFRRYAEFAAKEFGDLVDIWCTINEPNVFLGQSYGIGVWPPGVKNKLRSMHVFSKMCRAHRAAYKAIHRVIDRDGRKAMVGVAQNIITFEPYRKYNLLDNAFIFFADKFFNRQFFIWTGGLHDYVGINYYFHYRVQSRPTKASSLFFEVHTENRETSDVGWEVNPAGLFEAVMSMRRYGKPIYITENGMANGDDGKRPRVLIQTLKELYHAIKAGADVRGYFHWSLMDNYEWEKGFAPRFGLVAIDYHTLKRTPRRSAYVYAEICKENGIPHSLLKFLGHGVRW